MDLREGAPLITVADGPIFLTEVLEASIHDAQKGTFDTTAIPEWEDVAAKSVETLRDKFQISGSYMNDEWASAELPLSFDGLELVLKHFDISRPHTVLESRKIRFLLGSLELLEMRCL